MKNKLLMVASAILFSTLSVFGAANPEGKLGIHLMWINNQPLKEIEYVFPKEKTSEISSAVKGWAEINQDLTTEIVFWYDSLTVSAEAANNTKEKIMNDVGCHLLERFSLRDIRSLETVKETSTLFELDVPVYFRADLVRMLIGYEALTNIELPFYCQTYCYSDLNVTPEPKSYILSEKTEKVLEVFSIAFLHSHALRMENKFILMRYHPKLMKAIKDVFITCLKVRFGEYRSALMQARVSSFNCDQAVYDITKETFFPYYYALIKGGKVAAIHNLCSNSDFLDSDVLDLDNIKSTDFWFCLNPDVIYHPSKIEINNPDDKKRFVNLEPEKLIDFKSLLGERQFFPTIQMKAPQSHFFLGGYKPLKTLITI